MRLQSVLPLLIAYLLGSMPFGYLIVKTKLGKDVRETGSGSTGATNVMRSAGRLGGILTFLLDVGKGWLAVFIAKQWAAENSWIVAAAALAAIFGHIFPVFLNFKGGKGVATGVGVFMAIYPEAVVAVLVIFVIVVWMWGYISLGSIVATAAFPIVTCFLGYQVLPLPLIGAIFLGAAVIIARHGANIGRLMRGTESRLTGFSKQ